MIPRNPVYLNPRALSPINNLKLTPGVHAGILQVVIQILLVVAVQLAHKGQHVLLLQAVLEIFAHRQGEQIRPVQQQPDVLPAKLLEDAGEDELEPALAVRHPCQRLVLGLVLEDALRVFWGGRRKDVDKNY